MPAHKLSYWFITCPKTELCVFKALLHTEHKGQVSKPICKDTLTPLGEMHPMPALYPLFPKNSPKVIETKALPVTPATQTGVILLDEFDSA